jgi:outer membrane murein-binding lipoprotein Lpp
MHLDAETWAVIATVAIATIAWAGSIHAKVAVIASAVESLPDVVEELRDSLEEHEARLARHDEEIATLQAAARPRR